MIRILRPMLELSVILPGMLLAYLPMRSHLRMRPLRLLAVLAPTLFCLCVGGGLICYYANISTFSVMTALILGLSLVYMRTVDVSRWKSANIAIAVCAIFACLNSISRAINAMITTETELWFTIGAGLAYHLLCWLFIAAAYYPATHAARVLVNDENIAQTWYFFWILPIIFIGINLFMIPRYEGTLYQGRIMQGYIVISLLLLAILGLFYGMFYAMAQSLNKNLRLQQENQFLSMQQAQYDTLCAAIEETRHARHDMRHHFNALAGYAEREEWEELKQHLEQAQSKIPKLDMRFSENRAADGVIGYYCALAKRESIPFLAKVDLPKELPVDDMDLSLVLANLLENALEASLRTDAEKRRIHIEARLHSTHVLLLTVENTYAGEVRAKDGVFQSSKRKGSGTGIQSVRRIAEKNGGACDFSYSDGIFRANVMLRK